MAPRTRSQGIRPLPLLPTELKREILRFCDPPTLANASLCSLAFLELASPLLYDEITITGLPHLCQLFGSRPSGRPFASLLSLDHCRTLTFVGLKEDLVSGTAMAKYRILHDKNLSIDTFDLTFYVDEETDEEVTATPWATLLNLFNPTHATLRCSSNLDFAWIPLSQAQWTRLSSISFDRCLMDEDLEECCAFSSSDPNAVVAVEFDLSRYGEDDCIVWLDYLTYQIGWYGKEMDGSGGSWLEESVQVSEVVFRVVDAERLKGCADSLEGRWELNGVYGDLLRRTKEKFRVVLRQ